MVLERFSKGAAATAGAGAGGFAGGFFSSPTFIILGALAVILLFFQGDIRKAFGSLGKIELPAFPDITFPDITFPDITFPTFEFPELPSFDFLGGLFGGGEPQVQGILPLPPDVEDIGLIEDPATTCPCGSTVIQDIEGDVSQVCIPCPVPEEGDPDFIGPIFEEPPFMLADVPSIPNRDPTEFQPPIELPEGFVGEGPSFEGGTIFETPIEFLSLSQIIDRFDVTASQAADILARARDDFGDFDFGTSTGSGIFGPPTGEERIITGGATLESEEQRAACVSCQLFGLNCPICAGTI